MDVKPIKNDADLETATVRIGVLWDLEDQASRDELDVLTALVHAYEEIHYPIEPVSALEAIKFHLDQNGFGQKDLAKLLGSRSRATEVLSGKRSLSLRMIRKLHKEWRIPLESLVAEHKRRRSTIKRRKPTRKAS